MKISAAIQAGSTPYPIILVCRLEPTPIFLVFLVFLPEASYKTLACLPMED